MGAPPLAKVTAPFLRARPEGGVEITDAAGFRRQGVEALVRHAVFGPEAERPMARWLLWESAYALGVASSSIHGLYMARGRGEVGGFTVPALNLRGMAFDSARAAFRAAHASDAAAVIFEIAKSEMGYTDQSPAEYASVILAAAIREGHRGPVFIQGDHFQFKASSWKADAAGTEGAIVDLVRQAVAAGFHNIDIDASTLVDLSKKKVPQQQQVNADLTARLTALIRSIEPPGLTVSVGGEIGEVGRKNSTEGELRAYLDLYRKNLSQGAPGAAGLSKVSVQTGTTHGGIPLPDGRVAEVDVDLGTLERLSRVAVKEYGLAGCVQHGASTLPDDLFHKFPEAGTAEIHLATGFQNTLLDHDAFPEALTHRMQDWLRTNCADERKPAWTEEQFFYKTRKKTFGPFKQDLWNLPEDVKRGLMATLEERFAFLFAELKIGGTRTAVDRHVAPVRVKHAAPQVAATRAVKR